MQTRDVLDELDRGLSSAVSVLEREYLDSMRRMFWRDAIGGHILSGGKLRGVALGAPPDWTTALCERGGPHDDGLARAAELYRNRLADQLVALAEEWGVDDLLAERYEGDRW